MTVQHFKQMAYQEIAAHSVVDCFSGQPRVEGLSYQIDPGKEANTQASFIEEVGFRNADVKLSQAQLLQNIRDVQMRQYLPPSRELVEIHRGRAFRRHSRGRVPDVRRHRGPFPGALRP
jgi:type III restriction enzyme